MGRRRACAEPARAERRQTADWGGDDLFARAAPRRRRADDEPRRAARGRRPRDAAAATPAAAARPLDAGALRTRRRRRRPSSAGPAAGRARAADAAHGRRSGRPVAAAAPRRAAGPRAPSSRRVAARAADGASRRAPSPPGRAPHRIAPSTARRRGPALLRPRPDASIAVPGTPAALRASVSGVPSAQRKRHPPRPSCPLSPLRHPMKTQMSRFQIHDDADRARGLAAGPQGRARPPAASCPNFLGVLAGSPAALRAYARFRSELRHGTLAAGDARAHRARRRRALRLRSPASRCTRAPPARRASASTRSRSPASGTPTTRARRRSCATSSRSSSTGRAARRTSTRRRARPAGPTSSSSRRSRSSRWSRFTAMVNVAGDVPVDGSVEEPRSRAADGRAERHGAPARQPSSRRPRRGRAAARTYHEAVELIGKRWTGAIVVRAAQPRQPLRFSEIAPGGPAAVRPPAVRAHEGARGARDRRAPGAPRAAGARRVRADARWAASSRPRSPSCSRWAQRWLGLIGRCGQLARGARAGPLGSATASIEPRPPHRRRRQGARRGARASASSASGSPTSSAS